MPSHKDHTYKIFKHYISKYNNYDHIQICYNLNDQIHNKNGFAILWNDGYKRYVLDDKIIGDNDPTNNIYIYFESDKSIYKMDEIKGL